MAVFKILLLLTSVFALNINSAPIPIPLNLEYANTGNLKFDLHLPNNDTVQIGLFFKLLTISDVKNASVATTPSEEEDITTSVPIKKYVTVEEAIEGFRQALLKKERDIAGIIESKDVFYRHFKLEFDEDKMLAIRCTYDSNYAARSLNISCYEYHEFETERILSNGEVELIKEYDPNYKSTDVEYVDVKTMRQTYQMTVS